MWLGGFSFFRKSTLVPLYGHPDSPCKGAQLPEIYNPSSIFIQDNTRTHTATIKLLKEEICKRYPELSDMLKNISLELLRKAVAEVWNDFPDELLQNLAKSV
ncbi:hypothetical protein V8F33_011158 [Rhypophila sp. PSN 637]